MLTWLSRSLGPGVSPLLLVAPGNRSCSVSADRCSGATVASWLVRLRPRLAGAPHSTLPVAQSLPFTVEPVGCSSLYSVPDRAKLYLRNNNLFVTARNQLTLILLSSVVREQCWSKLGLWIRCVRTVSVFVVTGVAFQGDGTPTQPPSVPEPVGRWSAWLLYLL